MNDTSMTRLRIATFNLENLDARPGRGPPLKARIAVLRPQLLRLEADLLCLQEVNAQEASSHRSRRLAALEQLLRDTPYSDYARMVSTGPSGTGPADVQNLVLLSRLPIETSKQLWHDLVPPIAYSAVTAVPETANAVEARFDRPVLYAAIALPNGRRLHLLNLHLKAPLAAAIPGQKESAFVWRSTAGWAEGFFLAGLKRAGQALETRLFLERLFAAEPEALIAVCGDFNAEGHEMPVRILHAGEEDTGSRALAARSMIALDGTIEAARRYTVLHAGRAVMFDHILVSRALFGGHQRTESHNETLRDEVLEFDPTQPAPISYHAPLVAEFTLPD